MALRNRPALDLCIRQERQINQKSKGRKLLVSFGPPALLVVQEGLCYRRSEDFFAGTGVIRPASPVPVKKCGREDLNLHDQ